MAAGIREVREHQVLGENQALGIRGSYEGHWSKNYDTFCGVPTVYALYYIQYSKDAQIAMLKSNASIMPGPPLCAREEIIHGVSYHTALRFRSAFSFAPRNVLFPTS